MEENRPKPPWSGWGYVVIVVAAMLAAWFIVRPLGLEVRNVFQTLVDAFGSRR